MILHWAMLKRYHLTRFGILLQIWNVQGSPVNPKSSLWISAICEDFSGRNEQNSFGYYWKSARCMCKWSPLEKTKHYRLISSIWWAPRSPPAAGLGNGPPFSIPSKSRRQFLFYILQIHIFFSEIQKTYHPWNVFCTWQVHQDYSRMMVENYNHPLNRL